MVKRDKNRLRVLRADRRITQLDTAVKAGIVVTRYWKIENGYVEPTADERGKIARALRTSVAEAFPSSESIAS